jgi:hypothetical protein
MRSIFLSTLLPLLCTACKSGQNPPVRPAQPEPMTFRLEAGGCRGYCPIYQIEFAPDGKATYFGERFVQTEGERAFHLTEAERQTLQRAIAAADIWQYPTVIETDIADAPPRTFIVSDGQRRHSTTASADIPQPLAELMEVVQTLADAHQLNLRDGVHPNEIRDTRDSIRVLLRDDLNAGNWLMQFTEIRLQLLRRTGAANEWLIAFDPAQITRKQIIDLMKDMEGVKGVH